MASPQPMLAQPESLDLTTFQQEPIDNGHHRKAEGGLLPALVVHGLK
jgi:hypothetical protein